MVEQPKKRELEILLSTQNNVKIHKEKPEAILFFAFIFFMIVCVLELMLSEKNETVNIKNAIMEVVSSECVTIQMVANFFFHFPSWVYGMEEIKHSVVCLYTSYLLPYVQAYIGDEWDKRIKQISFFFCSFHISFIWGSVKERKKKNNLP